MRDGCRRQPTVRKWPAKFGPYAPRYQPRNGEHRASTQSIQKLKLSLASKPVEGKKTRATIKKKSAVPKYRSISAIQDFPPILGRFNPHLSEERKMSMHTHLTQISDEYAWMELKEIRLLKAGALPERSDL
jgi:hypothetical protein